MLHLLLTIQTAASLLTFAVCITMTYCKGYCDCSTSTACGMQVATTATFSACALEALRMLLADLEQPGGTLTSPVKAPMALLFPIALALFPIVLPAGCIGKLFFFHNACSTCSL